MDKINAFRIRDIRLRSLYNLLIGMARLYRREKRRHEKYCLNHNKEHVLHWTAEVEGKILDEFRKMLLSDGYFSDPQAIGFVRGLLDLLYTFTPGVRR